MKINVRETYPNRPCQYDSLVNRNYKILVLANLKLSLVKPVVIEKEPLKTAVFVKDLKYEIDTTS